MNPDTKKTPSPSSSQSPRRDRPVERETQPRPWWSLGDWRAAIAEPEFVLV